MKIGTIKDLLGAQVICCEEGFHATSSPAAAIRMSDVLAYEEVRRCCLRGLLIYRL